MDIGQAEDWLLDLARRHRLSPSQRQIVQRMLGMFPDVAFLSTIEISKRAGVSQPTVTRLATALGFAGYPDFRAALRAVVLSSVTPPATGLSAAALSPAGSSTDNPSATDPSATTSAATGSSATGSADGTSSSGPTADGPSPSGGAADGTSFAGTFTAPSPGARIPSPGTRIPSPGAPASSPGARVPSPGARVPSPRHSAIDQETANVAGLARAARHLPAAVEALAATSPLGVVGLRASAALADYFGYFARRALPAVQVCTDAGSAGDFVLQLRQEGATAALFFAMPRYPAATVSAMRLARGLGLTTVVIADTALAPFAGDADVLLVAPVGTGLVFDSHAAVVVLAVSLLDAIAATDPGRTQERLEAHEALVDRWVY
ncbi:MurR/RpiR family transcriptional regulator [Actinoplanes sp. CA-131856]